MRSDIEVGLASTSAKFDTSSPNQLRSWYSTPGLSVHGLDHTVNGRSTSTFVVCLSKIVEMRRADDGSVMISTLGTADEYVSISLVGTTPEQLCDLVAAMQTETEGNESETTAV